MLEIECWMFDVSHRVRLKAFYAAFRPDRLITFAWHPGDVPRGIIADIVEDPPPQPRRLLFQEILNRTSPSHLRLPTSDF